MPEYRVLELPAGVEVAEGEKEGTIRPTPSSRPEAAPPPWTLPNHIYNNILGQRQKHVLWNMKIRLAVRLIKSTSLRMFGGGTQPTLTVRCPMWPMPQARSIATQRELQHDSAAVSSPHTNVYKTE